MKKLLSVFAVAALSTTSAMSVVACGVKKDSDVWVVTDTGKVKDKSFNESAFNAANKFLSQDLKREGQSSYLEPKSPTDLEPAYQTSRKNGGKGLILPGYQHANHIAKASEVYSEGDAPGTVVFLDGSSVKSGEEHYENVVGVLFKAEISGFYAGVASILYNFEKNNLKPVITAYGGGEHSPFATSNALAGYFSSVMFMNDLIEDSKTNENELLNSLLDIIGKKPTDVKDAKVEFAPTQNFYGTTAMSANNFFSGTFAQGDGTPLSTKLIVDGKADVIFPFAGPQTEDTLKVIKDRKSNALVVGADVDQTNLYGNYKDKFITSALKNLEGAGRAALVHSKAFKSENIEIDKDIIEGTDQHGNPIEGDWDGKDVWFGGQIATGKDNKFSADKAEKLMELLKAPGEKLSETYQDGTNLTQFSYVFSKEFIASLAKSATGL
ncbi:BMP family ABC transporter substrate-binding protein [Spiroplasma alleghenense]|uniref:Ribose/galactose ABC transporter substrate-binding protein n=1 Tax=Spiroplasma alleghenense TaxID=216931 RepID=A0A345Z2D2_9MOLU|nr:BMP family ABC transporter substrate-binding protein [Spiroplasma alleghenense]AXK50761.1 ribose/galactose ABC transporter substrate-binding protein [Spiroplasma alleghenense]